MIQGPSKLLYTVNDKETYIKHRKQLMEIDEKPSQALDLKKDDHFR